MQYVSLGLSILTVVFCILTFFFNRNNDTKKDTKDEKKDAEATSFNWGVVTAKLDILEKQVNKILDKLDSYDRELDEKIEKAIAKHEHIYHNK